MNLITNIVQDALKKLDLDGINTKDMDIIITEAFEAIADKFLKHKKTTQPKPLG